MKVNINHPSFISFLENITNTILSNVNVSNYFTLTQDKKLAIQYVVFKLLKNTISIRAKLSDIELRSFVTVLCKRNEESENYEFAGILKDISTNFDDICEYSKPKKRTPKIKTDKQSNG